MVKIQVLGSGMIPRLGTIAPKLDPFDADLEFINLILSSGGLRPRLVNPITNAKIDITSENAARLYKIWSDYKIPEKKAEPVLAPTAPVVNQSPVKVEPPVVEDKKEESVKVEEEKKEESKQENNNYNKHDKHNKGGFKPINNPNEN